MSKVTFKRQEKELTEAVDREIEKAALAFFRDITAAWPRDTGFSVAAWTPPMRIPNGYELTNNVEYSTVLWKGLHTANGRTYGSAQMPAGGVPIYNNTLLQLESRLKRL